MKPELNINERPGARPQHRRRGGGLSIRQLLYAILVFALFFGLIRLFENHIGLLIFLTVCFSITLLVGFSISLSKRKSGFQEAFLELIATSRRSGLPLGLALRSFAPQCGFFYGRRLVQLASRIESGIPLADAVAMTPGVLPLEQRVIFRVAEFNGSRADSLERISRARSTRMDALRPLFDTLIYYLFVVWQISGILMFLGYFIAPKMQAIFADFGIPLPTITSSFLQVATGTNITVTLFPFLMIFAMVGYQFAPLILFILIIYLSFLFHSGRGLGFFGRFIPWMTTGERAGLLRGLADTIRSQKPIDECLQIFSDWSMRRIVRRKAFRAQKAMIKGVDWLDALRDEHILKSNELELIRSASQCGRAAWALEQLADAIESRMWYRYRLTAEIMTPVLTIGVASLVFFSGMAFFTPLVRLIQALAS